MLYTESLLALFFVLGLVWILYRIYLRFNGRLPSMLRPSKRIKIVERAALGDKRNLLLVEVGEERFLLGSTPGNVSLVARLELDEPEQSPVREESESASTRAAEAHPFRLALEESSL